MKTNFQFFFAGLFMAVTAFSQQYKDTPYLQDYADKFELNTDDKQKELIQVRSDRNNSINILSTDGLLQPWEKSLVSDQRYRPLTDQQIIAFDIYQDQFVYLTDKAVLSNAWAGKFYVEHHVNNPTHFVMGDNFSFLIATSGKLAFFSNKKMVWEKSVEDFNPLELLFEPGKQRFIVLTKNAIYTFTGSDQKLLKKFSGSNLTAISLLEDRKQIALGTENGIIYLSGESFEEASPLDHKLPYHHITSVSEINGRLWFGSMKGAFALRHDGKYDYYASKRWLVDDKVIDISQGPDNSVLDPN